MDPTVWIGLLTLVVLEIVLGIDNLIFIAILADKLPPHQRDRARLIGLSLALVMRLGLLSVISWLVTLTAPLFSAGALEFSGRDVILVLGGVFLLFKATMELHERLEGAEQTHTGPKVYAGFWAVVAQIVVLDAVFSLDAVITAVGMVDQLGVMFAAVVISIGMMMLASKPLTRFVNAHPTVVVLSLSFLLMIGLSLIADGFGFHIPKGYLYAAIGFSIVIETFNQLARRNKAKHQARVPLRERTAEAVLRLMGSKRRGDSVSTNEAPLAEPSVEGDIDTGAGAAAFGVAERDMVSGVLTLAERSVRSIMTVQADISWVDLDEDAETIRRQLLNTPHSFFPVCRGQLNNVIGVGRAKDLIQDLATSGVIDERASLRAPIVLPDSVGVLKVMDTLKASRGQLVLVSDEAGAVQGLVTPIDVLEAIAGEFPDEDEQLAVQRVGPKKWKVNGVADLRHLQDVLGTNALVTDSEDCTSLAGFLLSRFGRRPAVGEALEVDGFRFEVIEMSDWRIASVDVSRIDDNPPIPSA